MSAKDAAAASSASSAAASQKTAKVASTTSVITNTNAKLLSTPQVKPSNKAKTDTAAPTASAASVTSGAAACSSTYSSPTVTTSAKTAVKTTGSNGNNNNNTGHAKVDKFSGHDDETIKLQRNPSTSSLSYSTAGGSKIDLSRADLVRLLSYLEGELQARDVVIATLKSEKAKQLLYQAKYGRLGLNDPLAALQRDSHATGEENDFDEAAVSNMFESQLVQLERLISVQRKAHHRAKQVLSAAERRHARTVRELEHERQRSVADAAQGDDVCALLEKERERLKQEIEHQKSELERVNKELEKGGEALQAEKERHKSVVLYLINERRQLLTRLQEERVKAQQAGKGADQGNVNQLRAELTAAARLRDNLRQELEAERQESASLREIVRTQEEDLVLIRQNILAKTRQLSQQQQQQHQQTGSTNKHQSFSSASLTSPLNSPSRLPSSSNTMVRNSRPVTSGSASNVSIASATVYTGFPPAAHHKPGYAPPVILQQQSSGRHTQLHALQSSSGRSAISALNQNHTGDSGPRVVDLRLPTRDIPVINRPSQLPPSGPPKHAPPPPPQYSSPTGTSGGTGSAGTAQVSSHSTNAAQSSTGATSNTAQSTTRKQYVEPEIAELEAVINSMTRDSASMPPAFNHHHHNEQPQQHQQQQQQQQPHVANGRPPFLRAHADDGSSSVSNNPNVTGRVIVQKVHKRSSSVPRNTEPPSANSSTVIVRQPVADGKQSTTKRTDKRMVITRRAGTPNPPKVSSNNNSNNNSSSNNNNNNNATVINVGTTGTGNGQLQQVQKASIRSPLLPAKGGSPSKSNESGTSTMRRNPLLRAIGGGLRKEKKATQV